MHVRPPTTLHRNERTPSPLRAVNSSVSLFGMPHVRNCSKGGNEREKWTMKLAHLPEWEQNTTRARHGKSTVWETAGRTPRSSEPTKYTYVLGMLPCMLYTCALFLLCYFGTSTVGCRSRQSHHTTCSLPDVQSSAF